MENTERALVRAVCHEVDILVTADSGTSDWEFLQSLRLRMMDALVADHYDTAMKYAEMIMLHHAGCSKAADEIGRLKL